ncbi:P-loop NTPase [Streptomyces griseiscabiei]|uniref:P-loop NTPase n=1 Tax=Streptomyces griseiscabiei TaxID=2993540 RepID=A0ABU4L783_9ACTN|nr:P-loop NTPase [Streptomyces griseiscabiei]MBZ3906995.1 P-loop NTPase [Streptomyces griseiscabiei]MDX2911622.1 P-loop NTPase [Streptomyces griseiscabiei]
MTRFTAVYGTKGGVGKSTIAVNTAYALSDRGTSVGLVDLDLSGPNVQNLVAGLTGRPPAMVNFRVHPGRYGGVDIAGLGFFVRPHEAGLLSGKYLEGALTQILFHDAWQAYDHVIVDMPPGFDDLHRQVFTRLPMRVALVTTPHVLSTQDLARGRRLLQQLSLPVLGYVENMSHFCCEFCGRSSRLFSPAGDGTLDDLELLSRVPFAPEPPDLGASVPLVLTEEPATAEFRRGVQEIARRIHEEERQG